MNRAEKRRAEKQARKEQKRPRPSYEVPRGDGHARLSPQQKHEELQSRVQQAGKRALLEHFDGYAPLRNGLKRIAEATDHWAGIPMPIEGAHLVIEPKFPKAAELSKINAPEDEALPDGVKMRNSWWSSRLNAEVIIWEEGGKICHGYVATKRLDLDLATLNCADVWGIEQEHNALQLLGTMIRHRQMKQYLLTGMFAETSSRSGLTYIFRKLRPTVVLKKDGPGGRPRILTALCLHAIGYYAGSWAGAMTPSDDVVAHLSMMRGDEHTFWKRANQHRPDRPEAGI